MHRSRASLYTFMGLLTGLAFGVLGYRAARPEEGVALRPVFIAKTTLPPGAHLPARQDRAKYFAVEHCPAKSVPADAVRSLDELDGKVAGDRIREGTVLRREQLLKLGAVHSGHENLLQSRLKDGEVAYFIEVRPPLTQLQDMGPGDQVAVFICVQKDGKPLVFKLADSELLSVCMMERNPDDDKLREKHLVRLTYDQMLRASYFENNGGIVFVVRKDPTLP